MCYIPRNSHTEGVVYNATVYMKDGGHKKWQLTKYDAAHLLVLWNRFFRLDRFNDVKLNTVDRISLRSRFSREDDLVLS